MICSSVNRFFMSNLLVLKDWTLKSGTTQFRGDVGAGVRSFPEVDRRCIKSTKSQVPAGAVPARGALCR